MDLARNLKVDSVCRLQTTPPLRVAPAESVANAIALMRREHVGCVLVCDGDRLVGIFTERDVMRRVVAEGKPLTVSVAECMTPRPVVIHPKASIGAAVRLMEEGGYRHLPVVDEAQRPVSVVSVKDIVRYLVEHFPATVYNQPPDPDAVPQAPEGA